MVKKIIAPIIAVILMTALLSSCQEGDSIGWQSYNNSAPNYNNIENDEFSSVVSAKDNTVFYSWDGFYNPHLSVFDAKKKHHILQGLQLAPEELSYDFFVLGTKAYFCTESVNVKDEIEGMVSIDTTKQSETEVCNFYEYDLTNKLYKKLFTIEGPLIRSWSVSEGAFAFKKFKPNQYDEDGYLLDEYAYSLTLYDISKEEEVTVCDSVIGSCFVSNKLRYVTHSDSVFTLFEYDKETNESAELGSFNPNKHGAIFYDDAYLTLNFTEEKLILSDINGEYDAMMVLDIASGTVSKYTLPASISSLIAGEKYAYAVVESYEYYYEDDGNDNGGFSDPYAESRGIYKIDLSDGTYEKLDFSVNYYTDIFVISDDEVIIEQGNTQAIIAAVTVYKYDADENKITKLFKH